MNVHGSHTRNGTKERSSPCRCHRCWLYTGACSTTSSRLWSWRTCAQAGLYIFYANRLLGPSARRIFLKSFLMGFFSASEIYKKKEWFQNARFDIFMILIWCSTLLHIVNWNIIIKSMILHLKYYILNCKCYIIIFSKFRTVYGIYICTFFYIHTAFMVYICVCYWVTQKLPQIEIYTASHAILQIRTRKFTLQICGNL